VLVAAVLASSFYVSNLQPKADAPADPTTLTYYTELFPPYSYLENGTPTGISVDLLGAVTEEMGNKVTANQVQVTTRQRLTRPL
jgi:ABC-type amino acid transport substrate-binding protein